MADQVPVTVDNFIRAESDLYFRVVALKEGRFGKFGHHREVAPPPYLDQRHCDCQYDWAKDKS